jgi:hypothetical protein
VSALLDLSLTTFNGGAWSTPLILAIFKHLFDRFLPILLVVHLLIFIIALLLNALLIIAHSHLLDHRLPHLLAATAVLALHDLRHLDVSWRQHATLRVDGGGTHYLWKAILSPCGWLTVETLIRVASIQEPLVLLSQEGGINLS